MDSNKTLKVIIYSVICIILSYYIAILLHEFGHGTTAWLFGYKKSPFDIHYGNWLLSHVSEHVDYKRIFAQAHGLQGALIGVSGISVTIILFFISLYFLNQKYILKSYFGLLFFYWLAAINLCEIFTYIVTRSFTSGDIGEFVEGLHISPLWVFIPGTIFACALMYRFFRYELIKIYCLLSNDNNILKRMILYLSFWPLIILPLFWTPPTRYEILAYAANIFALLVVIFIFIACDPKRNWIKNICINKK